MKKNCLFKNILYFDYGENFYVTIRFFGIKIRSHGLYNFLFGNPLKVNCSIYNLDELLEKGTRFFHPVGICIAEKAQIGRNCTINQNVTIGFKDAGFPKIGDNVQIFTGATIIGDVTVGDYAVIGANSVVLHDVEPTSVVAGVPAKHIRYLSQREIESINANIKNQHRIKPGSGTKKFRQY